jgi:cyclic pyranopterin phosphate synthase
VKTKLSHLRKDGSVAMVDVGAKHQSSRAAAAEALVRMKPAALRLIRAGMARKGDVLVTAQIAGILAAKNTAHIIPLCHPLDLTHVDVQCAIEGNDRVRVRCRAACLGQTGVEMEALTGAAVAALTIYDMCKAADRAMTIETLELVEKSGGKSGRFQRKSRAVSQRRAHA